MTSSVAKHERWTEETVMGQQAIMKTKRMTKRIRAKRLRKRGSTHKEKHDAEVGCMGKEKKSKDEEQRGE